jgi:ferredoxin
MLLAASVLRGAPPTSSSLLRSWPPLLAIEEENEFDITLQKPLGVVFEEAASGRGLLVKKLLGEGSALESTYVWPGDVLMQVGSQRMDGLGFDAAMQCIIDAPEAVDLTFCRPLTMTALDWPNGKRTYSRKGEALRPLALRMGYTDIEYECGKGSCGSCELVLHNTGSGSCKSIRMCTAKMPAADLSPWELLTPDDEVAQEFFDALAARAAA